jgi:hypothetical protein
MSRELINHVNKRKIFKFVPVSMELVTSKVVQCWFSFAFLHCDNCITVNSDYSSDMLEVCTASVFSSDSLYFLKVFNVTNTFCSIASLQHQLEPIQPPWRWRQYVPPKRWNIWSLRSAETPTMTIKTWKHIEKYVYMWVMCTPILYWRKCSFGYDFHATELMDSCM